MFDFNEHFTRHYGENHGFRPWLVDGNSATIIHENDDRIGTFVQAPTPTTTVWARNEAEARQRYTDKLQRLNI
jgi:hypothetical protein